MNNAVIFAGAPPRKYFRPILRRGVHGAPAQDKLAARRFKGTDGCGDTVAFKIAVILFPDTRRPRHFRTPFPLCRHGVRSSSRVFSSPPNSLIGTFLFLTQFARRDEFAGCYG